MTLQNKAKIKVRFPSLYTMGIMAITENNRFCGLQRQKI